MLTRITTEVVKAFYSKTIIKFDKESVFYLTKNMEGVKANCGIHSLYAQNERTSDREKESGREIESQHMMKNFDGIQQSTYPLCHDRTMIFPSIQRAYTFENLGFIQVCTSQLLA